MDKGMEKSRQKLNWKAILTFLMVKILMYGVFSIVFVFLLSWADIINYNWKYVIILTFLVFCFWFFMQNFFSSKYPAK